MNSSIFRFTLDLHSLHSQVTIPAFLGDTGKTLYITFTDGGKPFHLDKGSLAKITIKRPTGSTLEDFCMIKDNAVVVYPFSQNEATCAVEGINDCDITLYDAEGYKIGSPWFSILVAEQVKRSEDIGISDEDYKFIEAVAVAEAGRQLAETGRVEAEKARAEAENARSSAEQGRVDADATRAEILTNFGEHISLLVEKTAALQEAAEALEERIGKVEDAETIDHRDMTHRDAEGAHPMSAIEGLLDAIKDLEAAISSAVSGHNTDAAAHGDIRLLITGLSDRLNAIANSDDVTLDDFKEIVAYIKANKDLIDSITASKVSVSDIVNDLATNAADKPLSAAQGVALKGLIDKSSALPSVSEGDEGKMLQVVDGTWQAVALTDVSVEGA